MSAYQVFNLPRALNISSNLTLLAGAKALFQLSGTNTNTPVYQTSALDPGSVHTNPVVADSAGVFAPVFLDPEIRYRLTLMTSANVVLPGYPIDDVNDQLLSQSLVGSLLYPTTAAETTASLAPSDKSKTVVPVIDVLRYGIVPNNSGARAANDAAMQALLNSASVGPVGRVVFAPITGSDTYYFSAPFPSRDGIIFDGLFCTLDFDAPTIASQTGFFYFVRNSGIENATINVDCDGSAGVHAGNVIRIGQRDNSGTYFQFGDEDTLSVPMGNITLRNLRITTNNPVNDGAILMFGGVRDLVMENVTINGSNACSYGVLYEFGTYDSGASPDVSAHASNLIFRNVRVSNLATTFGEGAGIATGGAYNVIIENLHVDTAYNVAVCRTGESLFYDVAPYDTVGAKRCVSLRNIVGKNITNHGIVLVGSEAATGGYLAATIAALPSSGPPVSGQQMAAQVDLGLFSVDGFALSCVGDGIKTSAACTVRNGTTTGCGSGISVSDLCPRIVVENVELLNSTSVGFRANFIDAAPIATSRKKTVIIRSSKICGSVGAGISLDNCESGIIEGNQLGFHTNYDAANETTQTSAVGITDTASGIVIANNFATISGAGQAYTKTSGPAGCTFVSGRGTKTITGIWQYGGPAVLSSIVFSGSITLDCTVGSIFAINANAGGAYTINAPLNPMIMEILIEVQNTSGGVLGAATFNAVFKLGGAWTNPANGQGRWIKFQWNGTNWRETGRATADIPL